MSWSVLLSDNADTTWELKGVIREASKRGILVYCAAREDKDSTSDMRAWPSSCDETFSIGAAHIYLGKKDWVGRDAKFYFPSQNVFDDDHDLVNGGTSAATALASGLASLFLYCLKKNRDRERVEEDKNQRKGKAECNSARQPQQTVQILNTPAIENHRGMMEKIFDSLSEEVGDNRKYINVGSLTRENNVSFAYIGTHYCTPHIKSVGGKKPPRI